jgi:hypothetical protein
LRGKRCLRDLTDYFRWNRLLSIILQGGNDGSWRYLETVSEDGNREKIESFLSREDIHFRAALIGGRRSRPRRFRRRVSNHQTSQGGAQRCCSAEPERKERNQDAAPASLPTSQPTPPTASSPAKDLPKLAVWDLVPRNTPDSHAQELTSILVSEIGKINKYEVYSQENVRTLAGWTEERMKLGCTSTQCLTALGQMDVARLISGSVAKIGNRYSVSLNLFDTQNSKSEKAVSEFCNSEDELIELIQVASRKLLGAELPPAKAEGRSTDERPNPPAAQKPSKPILKK